MASPKQKYVDWKRKNADVGCLFARYLANKPEVDGFSIVEIQSGANARNLASSLNRIVSQAVADPKMMALTIVIPNMTDLEVIFSAALMLSEMDRWNCSYAPIEHASGDGLSSVQLTFDLEREDGELIPSEGLLLGPFTEFPNTRRAPVAAFEIYVGKPKTLDAVSKKPTDRANLAHIDSRPLTEEMANRMVANTVASRRKSLGLADGEDDKRAKAKVSFVVPQQVVENMMVDEND